MEEASSNNVDGGGDVRSVELQATPVMPFSKPYPTNPSNSKAIGFALGAPGYQEEGRGAEEWCRSTFVFA
ncbi:hypothetical protein ZEAMMB73_Zm00001d035870 [Zea mays]|uniref:Uncharacterized protein n=1 Tax=Zea mays TaxID=4577 RepID=A0A1D6LJ64_MAIZE|nr:hypothetical protein ZEAMMB73_Zm00001d035870 [Zea mays]